MQNRGTTSWRRSSDDVGRPEGRQLAVWESEGGRTAVAVRPTGVMIVDNDMSSADSLEIMLHTMGYPETRVAYSGHAALAIADEFRPGIVLAELDLLDMDGYELASRLRESARNRVVRMIALTSSREHRHRELARSSGFERYLLKPVVELGLSAALHRSAP